jgi:hypothetical protein
VLYGLSTVLLYELLGAFGMPTFYDKLLQVPLLNLSIKQIDRAVRSSALQRFDPARLGKSLLPRQRNLAYMSVWATVFAVMTAAQGLGDSHPGQWLPFWQQACGQGRPYACSYTADLEGQFCDRGSGWACNEYGILQAEQGLDRDSVAEALQRGCQLGFTPACANIDALVGGSRGLTRAPPTLDDYPIILRGSKGPVTEGTPAALYALACKEGWPEACGRADAPGGN